MQNVFLSPVPEPKQQPPELVNCCTPKSYNLAREIARLNTRQKGDQQQQNGAKGGGEGVRAPGKENCVYCKLVMKRLDLYHSSQLGLTSERMLIYKRMQKQTH